MSTLAICWALLVGLLGQQRSPSSSAPTSLNYEVFKAKVQPIFIAKRPGHARCISCHATIRGPDPGFAAAPRGAQIGMKPSRAGTLTQ